MLRTTLRVLPGAVVLLMLSSAAPSFAAQPMRIGVNFLPPGWGQWTLERGNYANIFQGGWQNVTGQQPVFKPMVTQDLAIFNGPFRPMEMNAVNRCMDNPYHTSGRWADRKPASDREQYEPVAYEYQIDLCNIVGRDYWVNVPCTADDDYFTQLATLIKSRLNPGLKCYAEWGNEVWNSAGQPFQSYIYATQKIQELGIPGTGFTPLARYVVLRSCQMFAAFEAVFADQPHRLYKVMPGWPGHDLAERQFEAATDRAYNPGNVKFDGYAIAAYVGGGRDGASPEIFTQLRADLESAKPGTDGWQHMRNLCDSNGVELIAYECGVDVTTNAASYTLDPRMYDWFTHYYNEASEYFDLMVHFAYCGTYEMHVKLWSEQPTAEAYTYQAIRDWLIANPVGVSPKATPATSRVSPTMAPFGILNRLTSAGSLVPATGAAQLFSLQGRRASGWRPGLGGAVPRLPRVYLVVADDE